MGESTTDGQTTDGQAADGQAAERAGTGRRGALTRRSFLRYPGYLGLAAVGGGALREVLTTGSTRAHSRAAHPRAIDASVPTYNVIDYGAAPNGSDCTAAFNRAIKAAQASGGGTVYVPPGTYAFTSPAPAQPGSSIQVHGTVPVSLIGFSSGPSDRGSECRLVQHVPGQTLISLQVDGSQVQDLTLDCLTFEGGSCLGVNANHTLLSHCTALGSRARKKFTLYYAGPTAATQDRPLYNQGNDVDNCTVHDIICDDGFSFSYQANATISNITHVGSRLALYVVEGVTVTNYVYTPNLACNVDGAAPGGGRLVTNAFYITPPSNAVTISNFTTYGEAGIINGSAQERPTTNVAITNLVLMPPISGVNDRRMEVGNVSGLTLTGCNLSDPTLSASLYFDPPAPAPPVTTTGATGVVVTGSTIPAVRFAQPAGVPVATQFNDCTFPAYTVNAAPSQTFRNLSAGPCTVAIDGGTFANQAGGFDQGSTTTYTATRIAPLNTVAPSITGQPQVGNVLTGHPGTFISDDPTLALQWYRDTAPVPGATGTTYTVTSADVGSALTLTVTATNSTGVSNATSPPQSVS